MAAPLIEASIDKIRDLVMSGMLAPGARLPAEQELASMLGSSRNTTREAVRALVMARVLDVRRGDGTYVTSLKPELLLEGIGFAVDLMQDESILQLLEIRRLLEPAATAMAASSITEEDLEKLAATVAAMRSAAGDEELGALDTRFHEVVAGASGNRALASILGSLSSRTFRARVWRGVIEDAVISTTLAQHEQVLAAMEARDAALAEAAALLHVATTESWFRRALEGSPAAERAPANRRRPTRSASTLASAGAAPASQKQRRRPAP